MYFVKPPDDDQHKVVFKLATSPRHYTAQDILDLPRDRGLSIIGRILLKGKALWLYQYYDGFTDNDRVLIRDYVKGLRLHHKPGADPKMRSAYIHWFSTQTLLPQLADIRLGAENLTSDTPPNSGG